MSGLYGEVAQAAIPDGDATTLPEGTYRVKIKSGVTKNGDRVWTRLTVLEGDDEHVGTSTFGPGLEPSQHKDADTRAFQNGKARWFFNQCGVDSEYVERMANLQEAAAAVDGVIADVKLTVRTYTGKEGLERISNNVVALTLVERPPLGGAGGVPQIAGGTSVPAQPVQATAPAAQQAPAAEAAAAQPQAPPPAPPGVPQTAGVPGTPDGPPQAAVPVPSSITVDDNPAF